MTDFNGGGINFCLRTFQSQYKITITRIRRHRNLIESHRTLNAINYHGTTPVLSRIWVMKGMTLFFNH